MCGALQAIAAAGPTRPRPPRRRRAPGAVPPGTEESGAFYFRLSTRGIDQQPFAAARERLGDAVLRRQVLAGAYRLVEAGPDLADGTPMVHLAGLRRGAARGAGGRGRTGARKASRPAWST